MEAKMYTEDIQALGCNVNFCYFIESGHARTIAGLGGG